MRRFTAEDLESESLEATVDGHTTRIEVLPRMGANLVSLVVDRRECLYFSPDNVLGESAHMEGCFQMFPTPCLLTNARYPFGGREIHQHKRGQSYAGHGLVRDEIFEIEKRGTELVARLEWGPRHPVHDGFPWEGSLTTTFRCLARGLEVAWSFENRGKTPAPAGYGIHPFWVIPGNRASVSVKVPAECRFELVDYESQEPTGELLPVEGTHYDLQEWRSLETLDIDDIFWPKPAGEEAGVAYGEEGLRVAIQCSENMKHLVCYSPMGRPFVCVENLSCAPDAPNLHARGFQEISGLAVVRPGERLEGWVRYKVLSGL
jgi:aldose 1-epimerase